jgi:hypothetical protein
MKLKIMFVFLSLITILIAEIPDNAFIAGEGWM